MLIGFPSSLIPSKPADTHKDDRSASFTVIASRHCTLLMGKERNPFRPFLLHEYLLSNQPVFGVDLPPNHSTLSGSGIVLADPKACA